MRKFSGAIVFAVMLAAVSTVFAQGPDALNMTLFDRIALVQTDSVGPNSALWGYTAPNGREYALFGSQIGTHIVDITDKPLREVTFIPGPKSTWREMKVYKQYAYIVTESVDPGRGLQIVDLSGLPQSASLVRTDTTLFNRAHTIYINGHFMYVMGTPADAGANGGAIIFDLEPDPLHPRRVGAVSPYYYHDAWERNDTLLGAAIYGQGCDIYDVSDKAQPKHLATIAYPFSGTHNAEMTSDGGYVVTSDEIGSTPKTMKVWDIRDLNTITKVAEFTPSPNDVVHNVHVRGRYVIAAWYTAGVRIVDMIDPLHPREVGYYDTYPGGSGGYNGVWEAYGFFPSGKVIASDRQTGLYVMSFNGATAGSVSGVVRNRVTGDPIPGVAIVNAATGATIISDSDGRYYLGGANGASYTLSFVRFGYGGVTRSFTLDGDKAEDVLLDPLEFFTARVVARDERGEPVLDFSYAVVPHLGSSTAPGASGVLLLPRDTMYTLTVGKWGYLVEEVPIRLTQNNQEIVVTLRRGYHDNATLHLGWSFEDPGDDATTGRWTRTIPFPGNEWIFPPSAPGGPAGGHVFQTGVVVKDAPAQVSDVNGGFTTLTSPVMDLRDFSSPTLMVDRWFVHYKRDSVVDSLFLEFTDDGTNWKRVYSLTEGRGTWVRDTVSIGAVVSLTDRVRFRFRVSDIRSNAFVMAALDNVIVTGTPPASVTGADAGAAQRVTLLAVPNPMSTSGAVVIRLERPIRRARVELYSDRGSRVAVLHEGALAEGERRFEFGAAPMSGSWVEPMLPSGAYRLRVVDLDGGEWSVGLVVAR